MRKPRSIRFVKHVALAMLLMVVMAAPTAATSHEGSVNATVTADAACILLYEGVGTITPVSALSFGSLPFSTGSGDSTGLGLPGSATNPEYELANCSTLSQSFLAAGTNASIQTVETWFLDADDFVGGICNDPDGGTNLYRMSVDTDTTGDDTVTDGGDSGIFLTTSAANVAGGSGVAGGDRIIVGNRITMPCTGSNGSGQEASMSITYTAVLD